MSRLARFALLELNPHAPPLVRVPVNSFEFQPCGRTPQAECFNALTAALKGGNPPTLSTHRLRRGLPGYLILFATHASSPSVVTDQESLFATVPPYLRISHRHGIPPPLHSSSPQFPMTSWSWAGVFLHQNLRTACALPWPNKLTTPATTYYRGCWHVVKCGSG